MMYKHHSGFRVGIEDFFESPSPAHILESSSLASSPSSGSSGGIRSGFRSTKLVAAGVLAVLCYELSVMDFFLGDVRDGF